MGLLDNTTHRDYYLGNNLGSYQFTSLDDIITQFQIAYVGENKLISKIKRLDVAFHAKRALQELSFDTFKSIKSQQIDVPNTLTMILPHDYVNYTKLTWVDSAGIKHPLYPTNRTSNPFQIKQQDDNEYFFGDESNVVINPTWADGGSGWSYTPKGKSGAWSSVRESGGKWYTNYINDHISTTLGELVFKHLWFYGYGISGSSRSYAAWQRIDVIGINTIELKATATSGARILDGSTVLCDYGVVRVGVTSTDPNDGWNTPRIATSGNPATSVLSSARNSIPPGTVAAAPSPNTQVSNYDIGYVEWDDGTGNEKELLGLNVSAHDYVWVYIQSFSPWTSDAVTTTTHGGPPNGSATQITPAASTNNTHQENSVQQVEIIVPGSIPNLSHESSDKNSSTWNNYKSITPSENNNDDYEDDTYWPIDGRRYGLDPQHAQVNGSFYIDPRLGKIHFSSNISGKTVILDYISDSLGTDEEMQVHKLAEDAMYKHILCDVMSTRANVGRNQLIYYKKDKFAAVRKAKLRLSNIKLEELTQILRGKSKWIKH